MTLALLFHVLRRFDNSNTIIYSSNDAFRDVSSSGRFRRTRNRSTTYGTTVTTTTTTTEMHRAARRARADKNRNSNSSQRVVYVHTTCVHKCIIYRPISRRCARCGWGSPPRIEHNSQGVFLSTHTRTPKKRESRHSQPPASPALRPATTCELWPASTMPTLHATARRVDVPVNGKMSQHVFVNTQQYYGVS